MSIAAIGSTEDLGGEFLHVRFFHDPTSPSLTATRPRYAPRTDQIRSGFDKVVPKAVPKMVPTKTQTTVYQRFLQHKYENVVPLKNTVPTQNII
jgi:hypothetical protein